MYLRREVWEDVSGDELPRLERGEVPVGCISVQASRRERGKVRQDDARKIKERDEEAVLSCYSSASFVECS